MIGTANASGRNTTRRATIDNALMENSPLEESPVIDIISVIPCSHVFTRGRGISDRGRDAPDESRPRFLMP